MPATLDRKVTLVQATALNMIDMVGIGPFVVLPLVIQKMGGPHFLLAWIVGAVLSLIDGLVWAELGAAYPFAGGSYNFLKESYGKKWGKLMSFLYVWQTMLQAPLVAASGAIGFAETASFLFNINTIQQKLISGSVIILLTFLLYRKIQTVGKIGVVMWVVVLATLLWIIIGGATHHTISNDYFGSIGSMPMSLFFTSLGFASVKTIYSYLGYYNVCHLGGEIKSPGKNIPRSIFISIIGIATLYLCMNISVVSVIPWQEAQNSKFIISTFIEKIYGHQAAIVATVMVLIVALSSVFAVILGYSRIPYAAAADGNFFPIFARIHSKKHFPHISLLFICALGFCFSLLFRLSEVISAILAMRILVQFIGQAIGLIMLRKRRGVHGLPFKMPLYPLPPILAIIIWFLVFLSTGKEFAISGIIVIGLGVIAYFSALRFKLFEKKKINSSP